MREIFMKLSINVLEIENIFVMIYEKYDYHFLLKIILSAFIFLYLTLFRRNFLNCASYAF